MNPQALYQWANLKGLTVVGTGDVTHPVWLQELKDTLEPAEQGLYQLREAPRAEVEPEIPASCRRDVRFMLTVEISTIYKKRDRTRKVHHVVCLPDFDAVDRLNARLGAVGNLASDGRPILGLDSRDLLEICLEASEDVLFVPAHIWTPHFAVLGASSGFDSLEACYDDLLPHIFAIETGLSSDPLMNCKLSALDRYAIISNSDAHSASKLGREATCYDTDLSYRGIYEALQENDRDRFTGTIEFYPEEGKYHFDGHRKCGISWEPRQTLAADGMCPACGKQLTVGVLHRVEQLADRSEEAAAARSRPFDYLIPLEEVIAAAVGVGAKSKKVQAIYMDLLSQLGSEFDILRQVDVARIEEAGQSLVAEGVRRMRTGEVHIDPGHDGEYGVIELFGDGERERLEGQGRLFEMPPPLFDMPPPVEVPKPAKNKAAKAVSPADTSEDLSAAALSSGDTPDATQNIQAQNEESSDAASQDAAIPSAATDEAALDDTGALQDEALKDEDLADALTLTELAGHAHREPQRQGLLEAADTVLADVDAADPLAELDASQLEAVTAKCGPVIVSAGPGSGKTRTLTRRIAWLVERCDVDPESITAVTFTRRAATQMRQRLRPLLGEAAERMRVGTFHQIAVDALRELDGEDAAPLLLDSLEARGLISDVIAEAGGGREGQARSVQEQISRWKAAGIRAGDLPPDEELAAIYGGYEERLIAWGACDFDDLLLRWADRLRGDTTVAAQRARCRWLLVDEFQDVNAVQYRLVRALAGDGAGLFVIGDPDQAIYGFRGADPGFFHRLRADFPAAVDVSLDTNYRSTTGIARAATELLGKGPLSPLPAGRAAIELIDTPSETAEGIAVVQRIGDLVGGIDLLDNTPTGPEAGEFSFGDMAILVRTGAQADELETCLLTQGLPYRLLGHTSFLEERGAREALAFFRYAMEPTRPLRLLEALRGASPFHPGKAAMAELARGLVSTQVMDRAIAELPTKAAAQVEAMRRAAEGYGRRSQDDAPALVLRTWQQDLGVETTPAFDRLIQAAQGFASMQQLLDGVMLGSEADVERAAGQRKDGEAVTVMTMHAAKGLEFPVVFLCGLEQGLMPLQLAPDEPGDVEEERRLLYVGMTRAQRRLILTFARRRQLYGKTTLPSPSLFLMDIPGELVQRRTVELPQRDRASQMSLF
ncbi:MAG: UvrD-helicase domain-containing protein [Gemmatimonadetes bacterium]|nr:UvrD-helicase domain-containing protein [Gemmatimonadota bacterium]MBT7861128.1 UvrD-helicase domain-containing protein [Gemmatimonadota bacterium]